MLVCRCLTLSFSPKLGTSGGYLEMAEMPRPRCELRDLVQAGRLIQQRFGGLGDTSETVLWPESLGKCCTLCVELKATKHIKILKVPRNPTVAKGA